MGWSEKWKKKDESKMKVVICIIAKLAHATLEVKDFKYINYIGCIVSKSHKNKKNRLSKICCSMFMLQYHWNIEYFLSIPFFIDDFIMSNGNKRSYTLTQSSS